MKLTSMSAWIFTNRARLASAMLMGCLLTGCGDKGEAAKEAEREQAQREADSRATGSACRQAGRALEDCYNMNPNSQRAAVFAGWRDMNDYMRENKIPEVKPTGEAAKPADAGSAEGAAKDEPKPDAPKHEESKESKEH